LHEPERCEKASTTADLHEQGLRVLARIIARMYRRDIQAGAEPEDKAIATSSGSSTSRKDGRFRKPAHSGDGEE